MDQDLILSHLEELKPQQPDQVDVRDCRFHFNSLMLCAPVKAYLLVSYAEEDMKHFLLLLQMNESGEEAALNFLESIQSLLKDPEERRDFFSVSLSIK